MRKYKFNENFFESIDTEAKAYFLGLLYADGWIFNNKITKGFSIQLQAEDKCILDKFKEILKSEYPIQFLNKSKDSSRKDEYRLYCYSSKVAKDLIDHGCFENKTNMLKWPSFDIVPENLLPHFIRGYFDGDGCIWNGTRKKMIVKDNRSTTGFRERIVHNVKFNIIGNRDFITGLQDYLIKFGFSKTKLNTCRKTSPNIVTLEYSGRKSITKFYSIIYNQATIYFSRKYNKFREIICALNEKSLSEMGLIAGTPEMVISSEAKKLERSSTIPEMEVESSDSKCPTLNE